MDDDSIDTFTENLMDRCSKRNVQFQATDYVETSHANHSGHHHHHHHTELHHATILPDDMFSKPRHRRNSGKDGGPRKRGGDSPREVHNRTLQKGDEASVVEANAAEEKAKKEVEEQAINEADELARKDAEEKAIVEALTAEIAKDDARKETEEQATVGQQKAATRAYKDLISMAYANGVLGAAEETRLTAARQQYGITMEQHAGMLAALGAGAGAGAGDGAGAEREGDEDEGGNHTDAGAGAETTNAETTDAETMDAETTDAETDAAETAGVEDPEKARMEDAKAQKLKALKAKKAKLLPGRARRLEKQRSAGALAATAGEGKEERGRTGEQRSSIHAHFGTDVKGGDTGDGEPDGINLLSGPNPFGSAVAGYVKMRAPLKKRKERCAGCGRAKEGKEVGVV
jgi:hypothetical protein